MLLKSVTIAGFRGINDPIEIVFNERLTLITGANSHGKTSITEALEFLVYGETSKVEEAQNNKEEFKGAYRNVHFPRDKSAYITAILSDPGSGHEYSYGLTIAPDDTVCRTLDGTIVPAWTIPTLSNREYSPFVVQHALKNLLQATPGDRFSTFASLLGLHDVEACQQTLVNLCTRPEAHLSLRVNAARHDWSLYSARLGASTLPKALTAAFAAPNHDKAYSLVERAAAAQLGSSYDPNTSVAALQALAEAARTKTYAGTAGVSQLSPLESTKLTDHLETLAEASNGRLLSLHSTVLLERATQRLRDKHALLGLSIEALEHDPGRCPVCRKDLSTSAVAAIQEEHDTLATQLGERNTPSPSAQLATELKNVTQAVASSRTIALTRLRDVRPLREPEHRDTLSSLLGERFADSWPLLDSSSALAGSHTDAVTSTATSLLEALKACSGEAQACSTDAIEHASHTIVEYLAVLKAYDGAVGQIATSLAATTPMIAKAVAVASGTEDLSLIADLLANRDHIIRLLMVRDALDSLKQLKQHVDHAAGELMEDAFTSDLTAAVMKWYGKIKTTTDPDVHFSGFAMARAKSGTVKGKRVQIQASSYGVPLISAASSLSESKLNALGLSVCLATATRGGSPWSFVLIDDPIQSWDEDHEEQFITVLEAIIAEGKQVILLSHRVPWVEKNLLPGTRRYNGTRLCITGFNASGPLITEKPWASIDDRLSTILAISRNLSADHFVLQRGDQELRIVASELIADVSRLRLSQPKKANRINAATASSILTQANYPYADRIVSIFGTADPAHHSDENYSAARNRLAVHHGHLTTLRNWLYPKSGITEAHSA